MFGPSVVAAAPVDFVQPGIAAGITVKLDPRWSIDFEFVGFSKWNKNGALPETTQTVFVIDPGVVYNFGPVAVGLRIAGQIGEGIPFNIGFIPIVNKGWKVLKSGKLRAFVELDLPLFVTAAPERTTVSFGFVPQTGIGF